MNRAEYFVGSDPGTGNAIALAASDGAFDSQAELVGVVLSVENFTAGIHRIGIRFQDLEGNWGNAALLHIQVIETNGLLLDPPLPSSSVNPVFLQEALVSIDEITTFAVAAKDDAYDSLAELTAGLELAPESMAIGVHRLSLRFSDSGGNQGNAGFMDIVVLETNGLAIDPLILGGVFPSMPMLLSGAEYNIDNGTAVRITAKDGAFDSLSEEVSPALVDVESLTTGVHRIAVRFQDSSGWGNYAFLEVLVHATNGLAVDPVLPGGASSPRLLVSARYQIDSGGYLTLTPKDGSWDSLAEEIAPAAISLDLLSTGQHRIALSFLDTTEQWGNDLFLDIVVLDTNGLALDPLLPGSTAQLQTLTGAELVFDSDAPMVLPARDGQFDSVVEETVSSAVPVSSLSNGLHRVALRFQDSSGAWGNQTFIDVVVQDSTGLILDPVLPPGGGLAGLDSLAAAELTLDAGEPNLLTARDGFFDSLIEETALAHINAFSLSTGVHRAALRFQDTSGEWGKAAFLDFVVHDTAEIRVDPPLPPGAGGLGLVTLNRVEYFIDSDPGIGSATLIPAADATYDSLAELFETLLINPHRLRTGGSRIGMRFMDSLGQWGNTLFQFFDVFSIEPEPPVILEQPASLAVGYLSNATFAVTATNLSVDNLYYQWRLNAQDIPGQTNSILLIQSAAGPDAGLYDVVVRNSYLSSTSSVAVLHVLWVFVTADGELILPPTYTTEGPILVNVESVFPGGLIFYTLDSSAPHFGSAQSDGTIVINQTGPLRLLTCRPDFSDAFENPTIQFNILPGFRLTATTLGGGAIEIGTPSDYYSRNSAVRVAAVPRPGWTFMGWLGDASGNSSTQTVTMTRDLYLQAVFGTTVGVTINGNGSVARSPNIPLYPYGASVRFTAIPEPGNYFFVWGNTPNPTNNPAILVITNANRTLSCLFSNLPPGQVALTVDISGFGRVTTSPRGNRFASGQTVSLTAIPDGGQTFLGWSGDLSGTNNPVAITLNASRYAIANFTVRPRLVVRAEASLSGSSKATRLLASGRIGDEYVLETSEELPEWAPLANITNWFGAAHYLDLTMTNSPKRFFRTRND